MIEYPLDIYKDYEFLKFNLLNEEDEKKEKKIPYSTKREDLICQMLMDYYELNINKDNRFVNRREIYFYEIIIFSNEKEIKKIHFLKTQRRMPLIFNVEIDKTIFKYKIEASKNNYNAFRINDSNTTNISQNKEEILKSLSNKESNSVSSSMKSNSINNDEEFSTEQSKKTKGKFSLRKFQDQVSKCLITITLRSHEVDGNLRAIKEIDFNKGLSDNIIYPKNKNDAKIPKDNNLIIEVKQNISLVKIFKQMKNLMEDFKSILPNEKYYYLGFLNENEFNKNKKDNEINKESNDSTKKKNFNLDKFLEEVNEYEKDNQNFKIILFNIIDNKLFDLNLDEKVEYSLHFRNEIKNEIKTMKMEIKEEIKEVKEQISEIKGEVKEQISEIKGEVKEINKKYDEIKGEVKEFNKKYDELNENIKKIFESLKAANLMNNVEKKK